MPSGENTLPPWFACVLKFPVVPVVGNAKGAFAAFSCATICSVCMSNSVEPDIKCDPSGATDKTCERFATDLLRSTVPEATSYTNTTFAVVDVVDEEVPFEPMMYFPSGVAISALLFETKTRPVGVGSTGGVGAGGAITTDVSFDVVCAGS